MRRSHHHIARLALTALTALAVGGACYPSAGYMTPSLSSANLYPPAPVSIAETGGATQLSPPPRGVPGVPGTESWEARNPLPLPRYLHRDPCGQEACRRACIAAAETGADCVCARIACATPGSGGP